MEVITVTLRPLYTYESTIPIEGEAWWAPEPVLMFEKRENLLTLLGIELRTVQHVA